MQPQERTAAMSDVDAVPLHLALVEPEIPPNTGNVARLCAATGCALHLVQPLGFRIDDRALKRAGLDYWHEIRIVMHESLDDFLAATYARKRWFFSARATRSYADAPFARGDVLVFGKETRGLPASLLTQVGEASLKIPTRPHTVRSLNLSTAVGIAAYAALGRLGFPEMG
ncbi:MAG: tRNA (cytidine(34)-2'-O)-methyltransferase [Candidatus Eremiobacteraeota bacterium]|nr:tRNA (cytidine(34)-2'-O)-methyltransferase [Candidatus Eremiobacteraeota bacterium]